MSERKNSVRTALEEISIRNLGVIESANIEIGQGLTVLTGETGAGKTMVLTALGLVLGSKTDADFVRTGSDRAMVSARFSLPGDLATSLEESGLDVENEELLITRTVSSEGKSRITIGGGLTTASRVSEMSPDLIEIHGQSTNAKLLKSSIQRELLDQFIQCSQEMREYASIFDQYHLLAQRIATLREQSKKADQEIESLKIFTQAFAAVLPLEGELAEIEGEILRLASVEELNSTITSALNLFDDEERSVRSTLQMARKLLESLKDKDPLLEPHIDRYSNLLLDFNEVTSDLITYLSKLEADPSRFEYLQERKAAINSLIKKFGEGSDKEAALTSLIARYENAQERMADLTGGDSRIIELEKELSKHFTKLQSAAKNLSKLRSEGADKLSKSVTHEMQALSMPNSQLICEVKARIGDSISDYTAHGVDEVTFLFAGHVGATPLPLSKVASGGESSRVMLALSVVLAQSAPIGTYIFDEVDAGVGGAAAVEVGRRLKVLSHSSQVIVVTHLAQVAVWADNHLIVQKDQKGSVTSSDVRALDLQERKVEIARMLSGQSQSATAQEHAAELLDLVQKSKTR